MSFYEALAPYYDQIFPFNQNAYSFLTSYFYEHDSILDIGAGTGTMAIALAEQGIKLTALEPEEKMAKAIHIKAIAQGLELTVLTKSMEEIGTFPATFTGMYCIGNTLAHLADLSEAETVLRQCYRKLQENGHLIIQLVNYDRVLEDEQFSFPVIEKDDFSFTRLYTKDKNKILFTTILKTETEEVKNTVSLFPFTSEQLLMMLRQVGFSAIDLYGSYKQDSFSKTAPALICVAKK